MMSKQDIIEAMKRLGQARLSGIADWEDNFKARVQEPDDEGYIDVDGYRVNQSYQYYDPELDQLFDMSTPYGRRSLDMMRAMRDPFLSEEDKNRIMQDYGNEASEDEWEQSRRFVDRVNQGFGLPSSMPGQTDDAGRQAIRDANNAAQQEVYKDATVIPQKTIKRMQRWEDERNRPAMPPVAPTRPDDQWPK